MYHNQILYLKKFCSEIGSFHTKVLDIRTGILNYTFIINRLRLTKDFFGSIMLVRFNLGGFQMDLYEKRFSVQEAAVLLGCRPQTLHNRRCEGRGPRYIKIGRRVFYPESALKEYLERCPMISPEKE